MMAHQWVLPRTAAASVFVPTVSHSHPHCHRRPSNTSRLVWPSPLWGQCFFPWVLVRTRPCVHPPGVEFLFPTVMWNSCNHTPLAFNVRFSGGSFTWCQPPDWEAWWGSGLSLTWENFCDLSFNLWVTHPVGMGFYFIVIAPLLPSYCGFFFVFGCSVSFLVGSSIFCFQWLFSS